MTTPIAIALKHMLAAGMEHDAIVSAIAEMETAPRPKTKAAQRTARWRANKEASQPSRTVTCDVGDACDERVSPKPPSEITPIPPLKGGTFPTETPSPRKADDVDEAFRLWNETARANGLAVAKDLTPTRRTALRQRLAAHGPDGWKQAMGAVAASAFLRGQRPGRDGRIFRADFDFALQPKSFQRLIEGFYGEDAEPDRPPGPQPPTDPWPARIRGWEVNGYWNSEWGPKPGKPGFQGPVEIEKAA